MGVWGAGPFVLVAAAVLCLTGCVKRTIVIETEPPGARVWINEHPLEELTPVEHPFITHGRYKFRLAMKGFRGLTVRERVQAPVYQWIPLDFFFEFLWPFELQDRHVFRYTLEPESPEDRLQIEPAGGTEKVLGDLKASDPRIRRRACLELARLRDPASAGPLRRMLEDPDPQVRQAAVAALRAVAGDEALEPLLKRLAEDEAPDVRWQAAAELEALGNRQAVAGLIAALEDRHPLVRAGAAEALKSMADPRSVKPLIGALRDSDTTVRRAAVVGLGKIGDREAVRPLTRMARHPDFQTRRRAVRALAAIGDPAAAPVLVRRLDDWDPEIRALATEALIELRNPRVVPTLIRYLRSWHAVTREHAAQALGGLRDDRARAPLHRAAEREANPAALSAMRAALAVLGEETASTHGR